MMKGEDRLYCYDEEGQSSNALDYYLNRNFGSSNDDIGIGTISSFNIGPNEIEEIEEEKQGMVNYVAASELFNGGVRLATIKESCSNSLCSFDFYNDGEHRTVVYVVVGNNSNSTNKISKESSMDALLWALNHIHHPSSTVLFLIHIYPETKYIPTPLGMIPIGQVSAEQKENHMAQERGKRRLFLQQFFDACAATNKVKVDSILIESDTEAKAILDLISICNIRKLILGTSKANLKKLKSRKGSGTADQILLNAPESCEVKIICEGKEMVELQTFEFPSPRASGETDPKPIQSHILDQDQTQNESFGCGCFKARVMH